MIKNRRHKLIREIIEQKNIETQCQLTDELRSHGFNVTQATVSRDIKEMGLIKTASSESAFRYSFPAGMMAGNAFDRTKRMLRDNLIKAEVSNNIIVVKTLPGMAQGVAFCLDSLGWKEIIGSVAGDDNIILVMREGEDGAKLAENIINLAH